MKVKFVRIGECQGADLTLGQTYEVLAIECNDYRILNDNNDPCLYGYYQFDMVDDHEPSFWVSRIDEDGDRFAAPFPWLRADFFDDYHDGVESAIHRFWDDMGRLYDFVLQKPIKADAEI